MALKKWAALSAGTAQSVLTSSKKNLPCISKPDPQKAPGTAKPDPQKAPGTVEEPLYRRVDCWLDDKCWFENQEKCRAEPLCALAHNKWLECMEDKECYKEWLACYENPECSGRLPTEDQF